MVKKNMRITYPSSEKIYVQGEINKISVGMRQIKQLDTVTIGPDGEKVFKKNNPVIVYDTSGPYSDPKIPINIREGLPRLREKWGNSRRKDLVQLPELTSVYGRQRLTDPSLDEIRFPKQYLPHRAKPGRNITQMYYAKRRIITPEMEYVAIRENQQIEAMGLKSYITPDFVRKEIAAGRAIIPANINHPEAEPMIIGKNFLVKINTNIGNSALSSGIDEEIEKAVWSCKWGGDTLMDHRESALSVLLVRGQTVERSVHLIHLCRDDYGAIGHGQALPAILYEDITALGSIVYLIKFEVREHRSLTVLSHKRELSVLKNRHGERLAVVHERIAHLLISGRNKHLSCGVLHTYLAVLLIDLGVDVVFFHEGVKLVAVCGTYRCSDLMTEVIQLLHCRDFLFCHILY